VSAARHLALTARIFGFLLDRFPPLTI